MNIFNSNDYNRGFNNGYQDGFDNQDKNYFKSGLSLKFALFGDAGIDTYNQGYNAGYEKGCYDRLSKEKAQSVKLSTLNQDENFNLKIKNMSKQTSFAHQVELLEELKSYLNGFQERLGEVAQNYESRLNDLFDAGGMMDETYEDFYDNYLEVTKSKIQDLINQINEEDIPFVDNQFDFLESRPSA